MLLEIEREPLRESDTVMRVLDRSAEIETRYGGGFVQSIDGLEGGNENGRPYDWLFFVNGIESDRGGADYSLGDGDRVWWDYRDWGAALRVPAVVGQFPEPFIKGFGGGPRPTVAVVCAGGGSACELVEERLKRAGAELGPDADSVARVIVGPWEEVSRDRDAAPFARGPGLSGVYLKIEQAADGSSGGRFEIVALNPRGEEVSRHAAGYGFIAATRRGERQPVWVVAGLDEQGLVAAARSFNEDDLAGRFALLAGPDGPRSLPVP